MAATYGPPVTNNPQIPVIAANIASKGASAIPVTGSPGITPPPTTNYGGTGNPLNEILYSKQQYDAGNQAWAANNANSYYGQLAPDVAAQVHGMNTQQLTDYINKQNNPVPNAGLPSPTPSVGPTMGPPIQQPSINTNAITQTVTGTVNDKIAAQVNAYNQALASAQQGNQLAIAQNNTALDQQLKGLGEQHTMDSSTAQELQNRRGGFYSGGLDYQLGSQDRAYATQEGNLRLDVTNRNSDIWSKNALLATQAAQNIQQLQSQAPDQIRQAIQDEIDRQRGINVQESGLTGNYNGTRTVAGQNADINNMATTANLTGTLPNGQRTAAQANADRTFDLNSTQTMAALTGFIPDGKGGLIPTNAKQQQDLADAWKEADQLGTVTKNLSALTGISEGTQTQAAKQQAATLAISQQNADNTARSTTATINNMNADNTRADDAVKLTADQREFSGLVAGELAQAKSKEDVTNFFNANAAEITKTLGADALTKMKNDALAPFTNVTPADKSDTAIREKAVAAAQKDYRWMDRKTDKNTLIKEYETYYH